MASYTTVLEYHIAVLQGLQKVAAYSDDIFNASEIDWHLNKQQLRLVEEIVDKRFEDVQTGLDIIRPVVVKNKPLQVFVPQTTEDIYEPGIAYGILPPRYLHLVTDRSGVVTSTSAQLCSNLDAYRNNPTYLSDYTEYVAVVPMVVSTATEAPYYYGFQMVLTQNGNPVTQTTPASLWTQSSKSSFYVINYVLENFNFTGVSIYWQSYRDIYAPNSFILVTADSTISKVDLLTVKSSTDPSSGGSSTANFSGTTYKIPNYAAIPGYHLDYTGNTLTEGDALYTQNANILYKSNPVSPKSTLADKYLIVYESESFLISNLKLDYVRIPRQISLSLNQVSELGGNAPDIIVNRTIEYLKLALENPAYSAVLNDNNTRDQV